LSKKEQMLRYAKGGAIAGSAREWADKWIWKEFWNLLLELCPCDQKKLPELQVKCKVLMQLYGDLVSDMHAGKTADNLLKDSAGFN